MSSAAQLNALKFRLKQQAIRLGFQQCGVAEAVFLEKEARYLEKWLNRNANGEMAYMANYFDKRTDPRKLVPDAKTVISVLKNYTPQPDERLPDAAPKISKYAWGEDYHRVMKRQLYALLEWLQNELPSINGRAFVDSAPVMDKVWAQRSGLGWIGKHTNLLRKQTGSFFFIGELIIDAPLPPDDAFLEDHCGSCNRCVEACPTDALTPYEIDARECISYLTIELKSAIPEEFNDKIEGWAFGCDICQDVCPWNRFSEPHNEPAFNPLDLLKHQRVRDYYEMSKSQFDKKLKHSPISRIRRDKFLNNLESAGYSPEE